MNKSEWLASRCPNEPPQDPDTIGRSLARLDHCATNDAAWFGGPHGMFVDVPVRDLQALLAEYRHVVGANERLAKLGRIMEAERNELAERVGMGGAR